MILVKINHGCQGKSHAQWAWKPRDGKAETLPVLPKYLSVHLFMRLSVYSFHKLTGLRLPPGVRSLGDSGVSG